MDNQENKAYEESLYKCKKTYTIIQREPYGIDDMASVVIPSAEESSTKENVGVAVYII